MIYVVFGTWLLLEILRNVSISIGIVLIGYFVCEKLDIYSQNWKTKKRMRKAEKDYEQYLQQKRRRELHRKEMKKYPLFYWKELSDGNS